MAYSKISRASRYQSRGMEIPSQGQRRNSGVLAAIWKVSRTSPVAPLKRTTFLSS